MIRQLRATDDGHLMVPAEVAVAIARLCSEISDDAFDLHHIVYTKGTPLQWHQLEAIETLADDVARLMGDAAMHAQMHERTVRPVESLFDR